MFPIYIPSRYRSHTATTPKLLDEHNIKYILVVHPSEYLDYKKNYKGHVISTYQQKSISSVRQYILDVCYDKKYNWIWMIDDDVTKLKFYNNSQFETANILEWITSIENYINHSQPHFHCISQIGFQSTTFNIRGNSIEYNTNIGAIQLLYIPHFKKLNINYSIDMVALEDTDLIMKLLLSGHFNMKLKNYVFYTQPSGNKNKAGGLASVYANNGKTLGITQFKKKYADYIYIDKSNPNKYRIKWYKFKVNTVQHTQTL
jgi:hypothetical protein